MSPVQNTRIIYGAIPKGWPVAGETLKTDKTEQIDLDNVDVPEGSMLIKTLTLSLDPYLRGKMAAPNPKAYTAAFTPGEVIYNFGVAEVLRSGHANYQKGQKIYGIFKFQEYDVIEAAKAPAGLKIIENSEGLPWTSWVGAAGMPGKTAFYGMRALSKAKAGESIFVTSAYGPVGSIVCQIAKNMGLKVLASAGSDEKVAYLRDELKVDRAFNYKTSKTTEELAAFGDIDIFWDAVGTDTLDAALGAMKKGGRCIECGMISAYNGEEPYAFKNFFKVIGMSIEIHGFLVFDYEKEYVQEFYETIPKQLGNGELKFKEHVEDLASTPEAFLRMLKGDNEGKVVIRVADPSA